MTDINAFLSRFKDLATGKTLFDLNIAPEVNVQGNEVTIILPIDPKQGQQLEELRQNLERSFLNEFPFYKAAIILTAERQMKRPTPLVQGVKHIIAVASGKGGVGKSTVAVNLAVAFSMLGQKTGLLDADIYGPSVPRLVGKRDKKPVQGENQIQPIDAFGLKVMSIGFMVDEQTPMIWRGPMVQSALLQMLRDVDWSGTDVLVIDMPPGTGDAQLTLVQKVSLSGAVIVSTPQDIALLDARKGLEMFLKVQVPILGIVENMSYFSCLNCGHESHIFGRDGAKIEAQKLDVPFLGAIPLLADIRMLSDLGTPIVSCKPDCEASVIYLDMAARILETLENKALKPAPKISFI